jgi:hypothetical protein
MTVQAGILKDFCLAESSWGSILCAYINVFLLKRAVKRMAVYARCRDGM